MGMAQKAKLKVKSQKSRFAEFIRTKKINLLIQLLLIAVIVFNVGSTVWNLRDKYLSSNYWQRFPSLKKAYYDSIYANKKGTWLPDEILYSFNGGALIKGESPILVNPEIPPVGKYLVGLSALLFNNEHLIIPIFFTASFIVLYLIGLQIFKTSFIALLPILFLSFESMFLNQLIYTPLIDIIHLTFLLLSFYFFNKAIINSKHELIFFILSSLFFGLFISTKFFGVGITVVLAFVLILILNKDNKKIKLFMLSFPISLSVLLSSYIRVIILGYPLNKFLGIQKWIFWYNQGHIQMPLSVWPLLLFNKWYVSWGDIKILSDPQWGITWPIITVISILTIILYLFNKIPKNKEAEIVMAWVVFYFVFLSIGDASARYFIILFPGLYLITFFGINSFVNKIRI